MNLDNKSIVLPTVSIIMKIHLKDWGISVLTNLLWLTLVQNVQWYL